MARIDVVPERSGSPLTRLLQRSARRNLGRPVEPVGVTAHAPGLLLGYSLFELSTQRAKRAPAALKHLAEVRAAALAGCAFCIDIGSAKAQEAGVTEDQLRDLHRWHESEHFDPDERLALELADGMTRTPVVVSDALVETLRERLGEEGLVELVSVIALENYRARFNWAFDIGSAGFTEGMACAIPVPAQAQPAAAV